MINEEIRKARIRNCLTQRRLGELMGYHGKSAETVVQNWEYGKQPVPVNKLRRLARVLNTPLEKFIP